jgi:sugar lactone lactonase YvrE
MARRSPVPVLSILSLLALGLGGCSNPSTWLDALWHAGRATVQAPVLDPAPGIFPGDQTLTITDSTPNSTIHYSLDGSMPDASSPTTPPAILLSGPSATYQVVALGMAPGMKDSPAARGIYRIDPIINAVSVSPLTLDWPYGIAVAPNDDVYVASTNSNQVVIKLDHGSLSPSVVAGSGSSGNGGDGGAALLATFNSPLAIAVDSGGNIYIADTGNNRVRWVKSLNGHIQAFAGDGTTTSPLGDGGQAKSAMLNSPSGVAVDGAGRLYISDSGNNRIRMVASNGKISTIAGTGALGGATPNGAALSVDLNNPHGIWVDPTGSRLYFSNFGTGELCLLSAGAVSTVAGGMNNPFGIAVDGSGNVYVADSNNRVIRKIEPDGTMVTIAGTGSTGNTGDGGLATAATFSSPSGVAVDSTGRIFIADSGNLRIRSIP